MDALDFLECLIAAGVRTFSGVPDSLLSSFASELDNHERIEKHVIAANEGGAIGYAIGSYVETGEPAGVYLQNSGLGNAINPLVSLAHHEIYGIPMCLIIGWRGYPNSPDEPQHVPQGAVTEKILELIGIPHIKLTLDSSSNIQSLQKLLAIAVSEKKPVAVLVPPGTFGETAVMANSIIELAITRQEALEQVLRVIPAEARVVVSTGMLGREFWEQAPKYGRQVGGDFLMVGGMGHAASVALAIAESSPNREVWCLDGDGAVLMHLGSLAVVGNRLPPNFKHVLFNNFCHDSVGGQPTASSSVSFPHLVESLGYKAGIVAKELKEVNHGLSRLSKSPGPTLLEIRIRAGSGSTAPRPPKSFFRSGFIFSKS